MSAPSQTQKVADLLRDRMQGPVIEAKPSKGFELTLEKLGHQKAEFSADGTLLFVNGKAVQGGAR